MNNGALKSNITETAGVRRPADRRVIRTRKLLRSSLIALLRRKLYEDITVQELIDEAGVGRSTFYCYCTGKEDLLRQSFEMLRDELREAQDQAPGNSLPYAHAPLGFTLPLIAHAAGHRDLYSSLGGRGKTILAIELQALVSTLVHEELSRHTFETRVPRAAREQFIVGSFMALLGWWLENWSECAPPDLDAIFQNLVMHGAVTL